MVTDVKQEDDDEDDDEEDGGDEEDEEKCVRVWTRRRTDERDEEDVWSCVVNVQADIGWLELTSFFYQEWS